MLRPLRHLVRTVALAIVRRAGLPSHEEARALGIEEGYRKGYRAAISDVKLTATDLGRELDG